MNGRISFRIFAHSWISDWNHGNAHFLRGLASELVKLGHEVRCYEERNGWSITNLASEGNHAVPQAEADFHQAFPNLDVMKYSRDRRLAEFLKSELTGADVVIMHEWNPARLAFEILALRRNLGFRTLFHDTHHRAYTSPAEVLRFPLGEFDGVLAFGETIQTIYRDAFGVKRVWTFHEAADTDHFSPQLLDKDTDVAWIGNWGDEERTREIEEFLISPAAALGDYRFAVHGVRYPAEALQKLSEARIEFRGYLPNLRAPQIYARSRISLHVPRRFYANGLSGIPTIRVFEALAAGSPLVCAPWSDSEGLFRPGEDYICVPDSQAMTSELKRLLRDDKAREQLAESGLETVRARHTCAHRAQQLVEICHELAVNGSAHSSIRVNSENQRPTSAGVSE